MQCVSQLYPEPYIQFLPLRNKKISVLSLHSFHNELIKNLLHYYKYECIIQAETSVSLVVQKMYTNLMYELQSSFLENTVFIPVPLHIRRLKWRGFNQSETIAHAFAKITSGSVQKLLFRRKKTKTQVGKDQKERKINLINAFSINHTVAKKMQLKDHLVLVDDVITTGSTLAAAAEVLSARFPYSLLSAITLAFTPVTPGQNPGSAPKNPDS